MRSVSRALALLSALTAEGRTLTELARAANVAVPTASRLLRTLEDADYVQRDDLGRMFPGSGALRLAYVVDSFGPIGWAVRRTLKDVAVELNETTAFFVRVGMDRVCVETAESTRAVRRVITPGATSPVHFGASGKVLMAFGPTERLLSAVPRKGRLSYAMPDGSLRRISELHRELDEVRKLQLAYNIREITKECWGVAAPVFLGSSLIGAFTIAVPITRSEPAYQDKLANACIQAARAIAQSGSPESQMGIGVGSVAQSLNPDG